MIPVMDDRPKVRAPSEERTRLVAAMPRADAVEKTAFISPIATEPKPAPARRPMRPPRRPRPDAVDFAASEKTAFISPVASESKPAPSTRPRREPRRARPAEPERTVLVSIDDVPRVAGPATVPVRNAPETKRPALLRKFEPIAADHRPPTLMRPAFDVDPADLARAASQETVIPESAEGPAALPSHDHPSPEGGMVIVSATTTRSDWTQTGSREPAPDVSDVMEADTLPDRRRRRVWLVPLLAAGGAAALVGTVVMATGDSEPTAPEPVVMVTPAPPIVIPETPVEPAPKVDPEPATEASATTPKAEEPQEPRPEPKPMWVQGNASLNPWVKVEAAPEGTRLGLSQEVFDRSPGRVTGFHPDAEFFAPTYDFQMQSHEVTWEELGKYIFANQMDPPEVPIWSPKDAEVRAKMPATNVPFELADAYCKALGGMLPSEAEWAWAARGPDLNPHPWGESLPYADKVRFRKSADSVLVPVATMSQDVTPGSKGLHDMLGNAAEWTRDAWVPSDPDAEPQTADGQDLRAVRGWPLGDPGDGLPAEGLTYRRAGCAGGDCTATASLELVGFRCVMR